MFCSGLGGHWSKINAFILALQVFLSTRRGSWILNRVGTNGIPRDMAVNRIFRMAQCILPFGFLCNMGEKQINERFNHALYGLKPKHRYTIYFKTITFYLHCAFHNNVILDIKKPAGPDPGTV